MSFRSLFSFAVLGAFSFAASSSAALNQAPPNFPYRGSEAVYVDFITANYRIVYDPAAKTAKVESEIVFEMPKAGFPIFDLVPNPESVSFDGAKAEAEQISDPDGVSKFRILKTVAQPGRHRLKIAHSLSTNVSFKNGSVASAFWTSDLDDRQYLEQYLPASFEYDAVEMHLVVEVVGVDSTPYAVRANGNVQSLGTNRFSVDFPGFYTASSVFFHLMPANAVPSKKFTFKSIDGRNLEVEIYTTFTIADFEREAISALNELEKDYGPFPHPKLVIYGTGGFTGGMEYSGATMSSTWALGHELFHSYNARSVMPANGNAGWIDEAMSSWRDDGYRLLEEPGFSSTRMAGHSKWTRQTDTHAYEEGARFLAWLAHRMKQKGQDLKAFLRDYYARHRETTVTTEMLLEDLIAFSALDFASDFDRYIYGKSRGSSPSGQKPALQWPTARTNSACDTPEEEGHGFHRMNPHHPRLTPSQLEKLLWP
jgi:hypothetical protein